MSALDHDLGQRLRAWWCNRFGLKRKRERLRGIIVDPEAKSEEEILASMWKAAGYVGVEWVTREEMEKRYPRAPK